MVVPFNKPCFEKKEVFFNYSSDSGNVSIVLEHPSEVD
jgi:hypothetical protein